jgi:hypothetical protein
MQCVQAAQLTFEDYFLSEMDMAPMKIVGYEGLLGFLLMVRTTPLCPPQALASASSHVNDVRMLRLWSRSVYCSPLTPSL